jgi:uncharacterized protein
MVRDMEFKSWQAQDVSIQERKLFGYAATFGDKDLVGDIIVPGAFKKTLEESGKRVKVFYNHMQPIGRPIEMREDSKGLYVEAQISKTPKGDEILELVKDGVINEMSIAYEVIQQDIKKDARYLKEIKLFEFGPVDFPANPQAVISGVKSLADRIRETGRMDAQKINRMQEELKNLLDLIESMGPGVAAPESSIVDTRLCRLSEEATQTLAEIFRRN